MAFVVILLFCGLSAAIIGKIKQSSFALWFLIGFCLPVLGTIAALCWRFEQREPKRVCPGCAKVVAVHDQVCMRCGEDLAYQPPQGPEAKEPLGAN
jgi:hypothetical protein